MLDMSDETILPQRYHQRNGIFKARVTLQRETWLKLCKKLNARYRNQRDEYRKQNPIIENRSRADD